MKIGLFHPTTRVTVRQTVREVAVEAAARITLSQHEWTWTQGEQEAMAWFCLWATQRLAILKHVVSGERLEVAEFPKP